MPKPILFARRRLPHAVEARDYDARLTASDTPIFDIVPRAEGASAIVCCPGDVLNAAARRAGEGERPARFCVPPSGASPTRPMFRFWR